MVPWKSATTSPSWGDDDHIYFVSDGNDGDRDQIYSVASAGGEAKPVTSGGEDASNPDIGEPGLLYQRSPVDKELGDIYLHTGSGPRRLTNTGDVQVPVWSPDFKAVTWLTPSRENKDQKAVWTADFKTSASGQPSLGQPRQIRMSGSPGPPAWGTR